MGRRRKEIAGMNNTYHCSKCNVELEEYTPGLYICPQCGYNYVIEEDAYDEGAYDEGDPEFEYYDPMDDY